MNVGPEVSQLELLSYALILLLARTSAFTIAAPIFGQSTVPNIVKFGLCMSLSLYWLPDYARELRAMNTEANLAIGLGLEMGIGFCVGYLVRLLILPAHIAGAYVGQELGFHLGQVADPSTGAPNNEIGLLFGAFGLVLFWVADVHHVALRMLGKSPHFMTIDMDYVVNRHEIASELMSLSHVAGLQVIAPLASVLFITLMGLMVLMRSWPQMTLFSFGLPMRLSIGLVAFLLFLPHLLSNLSDVYESTAMLIFSAL